MSSTTHTTPSRVSLEAFLQSIPETNAGSLRSAAARIDDLENCAQQVRGIERRLAPWFALATIAFGFGLILFSLGNEVLFGILGGINGLGITILLGLLPILCFYYGMRVRGRSRADREAFDLNQAYFVPHGGIYFAGEDEMQSCVVIIDPDRAWRPKPSKFDHVKPGMIW